MNVLYVSTQDLIGQQFNGLMLGRGLENNGHSFSMLVDHKASDDLNVHRFDNRCLRKMDLFLSGVESRRGWWGILPTAGFEIYFKENYKTSDIIHLQLLHASQYFSLLNLPLLSKKKPVVWTMHDPWLMTGHCVYPLDCEKWLSGCGNCPDLSLPISCLCDATATNWKFKKHIMQHSNVTLVVASRWMEERVQKSPILSHLPCYRIPFGLDTDIFKPYDKAESRKKLGIPQDAMVIAFRSVPGFKNFKGTEFIEYALEKALVTKDTWLLTFEGTGGHDILRNKYSFMELGWVQDPIVISDAMRAADIFLMPSIAEAFGLMAIEAMACGTPVVCFEQTSLPDVVHVPDGGISAPYCDRDAFALAIQKLLDDDALRKQLSEKAANIVLREYTMDKYVKRHLELYDRILQDKIQHN